MRLWHTYPVDARGNARLISKGRTAARTAIQIAETARLSGAGKTPAFDRRAAPGAFGADVAAQDTRASRTPDVDDRMNFGLFDRDIEPPNNRVGMFAARLRRTRTPL